MIYHSLLPHNTFGIEAEAADFCEFASGEELEQLIERGVFLTRPYFCIGGGSNLLFTQKRYDWTFLHSTVKTIEVTYENFGMILYSIVWTVIGMVQKIFL